MKPSFKIQKTIYSITLVFITLSGIAQMPIFKRYYIADIPGLGWLAKYYITHLMHYIFAFILIALVVYTILDFIINTANYPKITRASYFKFIAIACLIISGSIMVYKNISGIYLSHSLIITLDILHIIFCFMLLFISFYTLFKRKK